jgi:hypothetical protein
MPVAVGLKTRLTLQLAPAFRFEPQLSLSEKSPGLPPPREMLLSVNAILPVLLSVTDSGDAAVPTTWLVKERLEPPKLAIAAMPVPDSGRVCGLPVALSVMLRLAARGPNATG